MDRIRLEGIECRARLGVPDLERRRPQKVLVDLELELDLRRAGRSDDFKDTADYWAIEKRVRGVAENGEFKLVERLAEEIAAVALRLDRRIRGVRVAVHKTPAVMPKTREVVIELTRRR